MRFMWRRLFEKSTLITFATLASTLLGINIEPQFTDAILTGAVAILSAVGILTPEK